MHNFSDISIDRIAHTIKSLHLCLIALYINCTKKDSNFSLAFGFFVHIENEYTTKKVMPMFCKNCFFCDQCVLLLCSHEMFCGCFCCCQNVDFFFLISFCFWNKLFVETEKFAYLITESVCWTEIWHPNTHNESNIHRAITKNMVI